MAGSATGDWDRYDRWNAAIAAEFFTGRHGGRPVYLDLEDDVLWRVAAAVEGDGDDPRAELIGVVRPTLYLAPGLSIFRAHRLRLSSWKAYGRQGPPPVVAVLALLSLIAEQMTTDVDFRASNYYGRFLRTLGYSSQDPRLRQKVVRCFAEESHVLWAGLNDWLGDDPKVRGTPTAYAFDYRVHVGVPMSQALVRDADRVALHDLFADYRLSPGQPIPHTDMVRLLRDWLPQSSLSSALKTLCQHEDALLRVADVACIELAAWDGAAAMVTGGSRHRLAFVASYRRQPRPRLSLGMAVRIGDRQCRELQLESDAGPAAMDALDRSSAGCLSLAEPDDGWADVLNAGDISMAHALVAVLPLRGLDIRLRRIPRRLVVLEFDEARRRYLEVDRVRLGGDCMLLAADTLGPLLDQALDEAARPGWTRHEPGRVAGVPTGWRLYTGVTIVGITSSRQIDLGPLIPIAWTQLTLTGGLSLPARRAWLAAAPPEVSVSSLAGDPVWTVLSHERYEDGDSTDQEDRDDAGLLQAGSDEVPETDEADPGENPGQPGRTNTSSDVLASFGAGAELLGRADPAAIFEIGALGLADGAYRITLVPAEGETTALSTVKFHLLSPEPSASLDQPLAHPLPLLGLAAISAAESDIGVRGALIPEAPLHPFGVAAETLEGSLSAWEVEDDPALEDDPDESSADRHTVISLPTCMETGAHYFKLPPSVESKGQREIHAVCEHCGVERFFPARPTRRGFRPGRTTQADRLARAAALPRLPARPPDPDAADFDLLLEALSTVEHANWHNFERLIDQMDDRPWAAAEAIRTFSALGHVDVMLGQRDLRPERWSIAPPALVVTNTGAFLCGWRSELLLRTLGRLAVEMGRQVVWQPVSDAPTVIHIAQLTEDESGVLATRLSDAMEMEVRVALEASRALAEQLPSLAALRQALPSRSAPLGLDLERFDPGTGRWSRSQPGERPGGYRTARLPRRFWHFDGHDWRTADSRLVKWLTASPRNRLLAYDRHTGALACHLGAQLPGLYERAAVLGSGRPPQPADTGHLVYSNVPPGTASVLADRLLSHDPSSLYA
jgi:hypothetical protein